MSQSYEIVSWDGIISQNTSPLASVTIKPDKAFIRQFLNNTNNKLQIQISGTNTQYDNVWMALVDTSAVTPNCRRNFFDATQYWILTLLNSTWQGIPTNLGRVHILDGPYKVYNQYFNSLNKDNAVKREEAKKEEPKIMKSCNEIVEVETEDNNKFLVYSAGILLLLSIILLTIHIYQKKY